MPALLTRVFPLPRENAAEILQEYFKSIGGREKIFEQTSSALKGRKRGRQSNSATPAEKRSRKNGHPADSTPPATARAAEWKPPSGSWDEEVDTVDMCQDEENGTFIVYLTWKNGKKTQHPKEVVYRRCPQKVGPEPGRARDSGCERGADPLVNRCSVSTSATFVFPAKVDRPLPSEP